MPSPISTTLLVFAAILTVLSPLAAVVVAGVAVLLEIGLFVWSGLPRVVNNVVLNERPRDGLG